jgi:hypothetical protein
LAIAFLGMLVAGAGFFGRPERAQAAAPAAVSNSREIVAAVSDPMGGYWMVSAQGKVLFFGAARFLGSAYGLSLVRPIIGMAATPDGGGYWLAASDGGIFAFGDAQFYGSTGGMALNAPIVSMAATLDGRGYWLVASDGGIFAFGDALFYGSTGGVRLNEPMVGMGATPDSRGYWLAASDGGIFSFGDAQFYGSTGGMALNAPIVATAATPDGNGYWLVATDGGVFTYGDARYYGSGAGAGLSGRVVGLMTSVAGGGYSIATNEGGVYTYGDAGFAGAAVTPGRIALYGDSLGMQAAQDFSFMAALQDTVTLLRAVAGWAPCDELGEMAQDVTNWRPSVAVFEFSGNNLTPCMSGYTLSTSSYYTKYLNDTKAAIATFRAAGIPIILIGVPMDSATNLSANAATLNAMYASLAASTPGVSYVDAGAAVENNGQFTWSLPCLPSESCGPGGTTVVRSPDGVHFCPDGHATITGTYDECDIYSSGALRFAGAMLGPALGE